MVSWPPGSVPFDQQRIEIGARRIKRGGESGGTGAEDYDLVDFVSHMNRLRDVLRCSVGPKSGVYCISAGGQHKLTTASMAGKKQSGKPRAAAAQLTHLDARGRDPDGRRRRETGDPARGDRARRSRGWRRRRSQAIVGGKLKKGEALAAARIAGIMAAKRTHEMIPLCHQIPLEVVEVDFAPDRAQFHARRSRRAP